MFIFISFIPHTRGVFRTTYELEMLLNIPNRFHVSPGIITAKKHVSMFVSNINIIPTNSQKPKWKHCPEHFLNQLDPLNFPGRLLVSIPIDLNRF